jgi:sec-independent protein translocase protein TatC
MTLLDHLRELRTRVTWSAGAVAFGMLIFFIPPIGFGVVEFLLEPGRAQNADFRPQAITPLENLVTYFRVALLSGLAIGMPMLIYQTMLFVTPALTRDEKKWVIPIVAGAFGSFVLGMAFAYYIVLPNTYGFLFNFGTSFADANPTISSYMDLTTRLILVLGLVFQTPIVIMGLAKLGVVTARRLLGWWRFAIVLAFVAAAIATPTPDPITQSFVGIPIVVLYFVGVGLAWLVRRD